MLMPTVIRNCGILIFSLPIVFSCSKVEPSGGKEEEVVAEVSAEEKTDKAASYTAFESTIFPLLVTNCGSCHGSTTSPKFAIEGDHVTSHDNLIDASKVDFTTTNNSAIVVKLATGNHNCWSDCQENADEIAVAIDQWVEGRGAEKEVVQIGTVQTKEINLASISTKMLGHPDDIGTIAFEAETGTIEKTFTKTSDAQASNAVVIVSEEGGAASNDQAAAHATSTTLGKLTYNITTSEAGFYKLYAHVKTANPADPGDNKFYVKIDDNDPITWNFNGTNLHWEELSANEDPGNTQYLDWDKGDHTVTIMQAIVGVSIDKIVISKNQIPELDDIQINPLNFPSISFDLSNVLGIRSTLSLNLIRDLTTPGAYTVQNPTIINPSGANIKIRGIYPMMNKKYNDQNALFTKINETFNDSFKILSNSSSIFLLSVEEGEESNLSLAFDQLEIAPVE